MQNSQENIGKIAKARMAANDPLLLNLPETQHKSVIRGLELLNDPVEGFPGIAWFHPAARPLFHRNLRVWAHPSRARVLLMEAAPLTVSELGCNEIEIGDDPAGLAIYYRGWVSISIGENKIERCAPRNSGEGSDGINLAGLPLQV